MFEAIWILVAFSVGSLPFSVWLGNAVLKVDIRQVGDANPGAANVWRAGGPRWGVPAILLDFLKGAIPVGLANFRFGFEGWVLAVTAIAPILGHAFSPFLRFRGGKALAVTFGIWAGLTVWLVPTILGALFGFWLALLETEGWAVLAGMMGLSFFLLALDADTVYQMVWLGMLLILAYKHRHDLSQKPRRRRWRRGR